MAGRRPPLSVTGVAEYDALAKDSPEALQGFLDEVRKQGWIVKATDKLFSSVIAQFFARKGRFYYDPERMTMLDMLHEAKHLELFGQRGNWRTGGGQVARDELEAYRFEYNLGRRQGFSSRYMQYLEEQIERYQRELSPDDSGESRPSTMPDPFFKRRDPGQ